MNNQLLHTPDGVRDIYNGECRAKLQLQEQLHGVLQNYGFSDIQTPTFEFFNIFGKEIGTTPSKDLYKFFDKDGNTLVLRPDFTPSIARSAVKYYTEADVPVKLCYMGNTFVNSSEYQGRLRETTQCGAELIGDSSIAADAEILSLAADALLAGGLKEFRISVGHARFFAGLVEAAHISEEEEQKLRDLISNKNFFGVEEFIETLEIEKNLKRLFGMLGSFRLSENEVLAAKECAADYPNILGAIVHLEKLYEYLKLYGIDKYIDYELGVVSSRNYYTGIIFSGYTFGSGEPVVNGGRYDRLLSHFGKDAPAIGFAIVVDRLMAALSRQKISAKLPDGGELLVFSEERAAEAVHKAKLLRAQGIRVDMQLYRAGQSREDYMNYALKKHFSKVEFLEGTKDE